MPERRLLTVDPADWRGVHAALRARLDGAGAAVFPVNAADAPVEVGDDIALVIETSGSTGAPKRVALSERALRASAQATDAALGGAGQWLLCLSPAFVAGSQLLVRSVLCGTEPIAGPLHGFDAPGFAEASAAMTHARRYTALVPAQLARLVEAGESDAAVRTATARFDAVLIGGQALPASVAARALDLGYRIVRTYGSSETATGCVYDGYPIGQTRLRISDGVLEISGPMLADSYLGDPDATAAAFRIDDGVRWYRTGDLAELRPDGRLRVLGRADDVIISGGVKVALGRVEALVRELPGLTDAVVVGAPSARWGEVPVVVVAGEPAASLPLEDVRTRVGAGLGAAARPACIVTMPELPLLATGKPDRRSLAAQLAPDAPEYPDAP
ncbi:MAG: AMP-binding protein [Microbacterium sp.]|uniref:AMP-binding protein n=1 Tax=Microbacterium sp. TaxID=51671 RepID=UPI003A8930FF